MNGVVVIGILAGFIVWLVFIAVNVSVAFEIADHRGRRAAAWGLFAFLFPVVGPFLAWMAPPKPSGSRANVRP
jgi:hypothetical protein